MGTNARATPISHGALELVADSQSIPPGREFKLGLHFQLEKGWHIYWVNPGDSGEPPRVEWHLPAGLNPGVIEWPTPQRFQSSTVVDYGYEDAVLLMVPVNVDASLKPQRSAQIGATVKLLVCSHEMCIPGQAELSLTLPVRAGLPVPDNKDASLFTAAQKSLPQAPPQTWKLTAAQTSDSFVLSANFGRRSAGGEITSAMFFPLVESEIRNSAPQKLVSQKTNFQLTLRKSDQLLNPPAWLRGVLVVSFGNSQPDRTFSIDVPVSKNLPVRNPGATKMSSAVGVR